MNSDAFLKSYKSLVHMLRCQAAQLADTPAFTFLTFEKSEIPEENSITYRELDQTAKKLAGLFQAENAKNKRALLLYPPGIEYITAFFGCLYANVLPVPAYPPISPKFLSRLVSIIKDSQADYALTSGFMAGMVTGQLSEAGLSSVKIFATDVLTNMPCEEIESEWKDLEADEKQIAFLQYTSGSTSDPKGVILTHGNLLHNMWYGTRRVRGMASIRGVSWLPPYHDMGLIGSILQSVYVGATTFFMSPIDFLLRPLRWLEAITRYRAIVSGGPNFAFELCVKKAGESEMEKLDLSSWQHAVVGAEPVRHETIDQFSSKFRPCGFNRHAFLPSYGLAESTLMVTGDIDPEVGHDANNTDPLLCRFNASALEKGIVKFETADHSGRVLVGCGRSISDQEMTIADPETQTTCGENRVGEIWIRSKSVATGYWNKPEATEEIFNAYLKDTGEGPFLKTGDLGFIFKNQLFVTGRQKDLIIVRGRNIYPQDMELSMERTHEAIRKGCGAAFSISVDGREKIVLVQEIKKTFLNTQGDLISGLLKDVALKIKQTVSYEYDVDIHAIIFIRHNSLPKTSSGKIQRNACRNFFLKNGLSVVAAFYKNDLPFHREKNERPSKDILSKPGEGGQTIEGQGTFNETQLALLDIWADVLELEKEKIGLDTDFFLAGGNSYKVAKMAAQIHKKLNIKISLSQLFSYFSIRELAEYIRGECVDTYQRIEPVEKKTSYAITPDQKKMYVLNKIEGSGVSYNTPVALRVEGYLDPVQFQKAAGELVRLHENLRTSFEIQGGEPAQIVHNDILLKVGLYRAKSEESVSGILEEFIRPFDLSSAPLVRMGIVKISDTLNIIIMDMHHIITDGISYVLLFRDLFDLYSGKKLKKPKLHQKDYAEYLAKKEREGGLKAHASYWMEMFGDEIPVLNMPADYERPPVQSFHGKKIVVPLKKEILKEINDLTLENHTTFFMFLLSVLSILLHKYTGQEDIVIGTPSSGRNHADTERILGCLIKTLCLRTTPEKHLAYIEFLNRIRNISVDAFMNQDFSYASLIDMLNLKGNYSRNPLFDVMLLDRNFGIPEMESDSHSVTLYEPDASISKVDITLEAIPKNDRVDLVFEYCTDLFRENTIKRLAGHLIRIIQAVLSNPNIVISDIELISNDEKQHLIKNINTDAVLSYDEQETLVGLFGQQALKTPDKPALIFEGGGPNAILSYKQLEEKSNAVAHFIIQKGLAPGENVALISPPSLERIIAIFGILKSGCAYLPIDPEYPQKRIDQMLFDSRVNFIVYAGAFLTNTCHKNRAGADWIIIDDVLSEYKNCVLEKPDVQVHSNLAACVIYTSGSTGVPGGVVISHSNLVSYIHAFDHEIGVSEADIFLQQASFTFDGFLEEILPPLLKGGACAIPAKDTVMNVEKLSAFIRDYQVTVVSCSPLLLREMNRIENKERLRGVHTFISGGDILKKNYIDKLSKEARVYNSYGPTETTICASFYRCSPELEPGDTDRQASIPIGKPLSGYRIYILDDNHTVLPQGIPGEICISGPGLFRGYLNDPAKTEEKLIENPYKEDPVLEENEKYGKIYCTGDKGRLLPSGNIEFLGRMDDQIKIRGFRIEPFEIVSHLLKHDDIEDAVVLPVKEMDDVYLQAYIVSNRKFSVSELRTYLSGCLPSYMMPSYFIRIDNIPVTRHGKVDKKALLERQDFISPVVTFSAPSNTCEEKILMFFRQVLKMDQVGVMDNFFECGGDSIKAMTIASAIHQEFNTHIILSDFFKNPTVKALAEMVRVSEKTVFKKIEKIDRQDFHLLSYNQKRLWVIYQLTPESNAYNLSGRVKLYENVDIEILRRVLEQVMLRHESLRTGFVERENGPMQFIEKEVQIPVQFYDISLETEKLREKIRTDVYAKETSKPFKLENPPLLRTFLIKVSEESFEFGFTMHHIITDGWSIDILQKEMGVLYNAYRNNHEIPLHPLALQYVDFAAWQNNIQIDPHQNSLAFDYWKKTLSTKLTRLNLPYSIIGCETISSTYRFEVTGKRFEGLLNLQKMHGTSLFILMYGMFILLLAKITGQKDIHCGIPASGRDHVSLQDVVGFFINTIVLRNKVDPGETFSEFIGRMNSEILEALEHQSYPLEPVCDYLDMPFPDIQVFFNMFNMQDASTEMDINTDDFHMATVNDAKFDLVMYVTEYKNGIEIKCHYRNPIFEKETIEKMMAQFLVQVDNILEDPSKKIEQYKSKKRKRLLKKRQAVTT